MTQRKHDRRNHKSWLSNDHSRRTFLKGSAAVGSAALVGTALMKRASAHVDDDLHYDAAADPLADASYVYTTCLMCHSDCGMKVRVVDGVAVKCEGNPYHPQNLEPDEQLEYTEDPDDHETTNGRICAKGQAAIETLYNPHRIKTPLRRIGPRGSGEWEAISWDDALDEIADEMADLYERAYTDGERLENEYGDDLGPVTNQVIFSRGRLEHGPGEFVQRFFNDAFGTINSPCPHTSICEASRHEVTKAASGKNKHFKPDVANAEMVIVFGSSPMEASFAMNSYARKLIRAVNDGDCQLVVVDPRFSNSAAKGQWVPVKPGTDAALALGMLHWMINGAGGPHYDETSLRCPNNTVANANDEYSWTDATHLVIRNTTGSGEPGHLLTMGDLDGSDSSNHVVLIGGDTEDVSSASELADLLVDGEELELDDGSTVTVDSVFQLVVNRVNEHSRTWYSRVCDIPVATIEQLAEDFSAAGKRASADYYRGPAQHTNGWYTSQTLLWLNMFVGNFDHRGGYSKGGGHWHELDGHGEGVNVMTVSGGHGKEGTQIYRSGSGTTDYFSTNEYEAEGLPAYRPWFPLGGSGNFQEMLPSIGAQYPYPIRVLITYCNDIAYTAPSMKFTASEVLSDERKLPLFVAIDIDMSETSAMADIILPDTTFLERWGTPHCPPTTMLTASPWRQPAVGTVRKTRGSTSPALVPFLPQTRTLPHMLIDLAGRIPGLPGFGARAFPDGGALNNEWDWVSRTLENLRVDAVDTGLTIPDGDYIEARGGIFEDPGGGYDGDHLSHRNGRMTEFYIHKVIGKRDSMTGEYFDPLGKYEPPMDLLGNDIERMDRGFPFQVITYKPAFHTQSRTAMDPSLMMLMPENFVEMFEGDGVMMGLETGDQVRVIGPTGGVVEGPVKLTQGMKPGVIAIANSYGHWEHSSRPHTIDGEVQPFDRSRSAGIHMNTVTRLDDTLGDVCLQDKVGGSCSFYDTRVRIEAVR